MSEPSASKAARRVLIVDPDAAIRARVRAVVEGIATTEGAPTPIVDEVSDGTTALALWDERRHELVVAEIVIEGTSGLALLRRIRSEDPARAAGPGSTNIALGRRTTDPSPQTIVILVSQMSRDADRYWGLRQGATEYFGKPFSDDALGSALRRAWLGARGPARL